MKKSIRFILGPLFVLLILDGGWYFGTRSYLNSEAFFKRINTEKLKFSAGDVSSPWPGYFVVSDFKFEGHSDASNYEVKARDLSFRFNFLNLFQHVVSIQGLRGEGVSITAELNDSSLSRGDSGAEAEQERKEKAKEAEEEKQGGGKEKQAWVTQFSGARIVDLNRVQVADWLWTGNAGLATDFTVSSKGLFTLDEAEVTAAGLDARYKAKPFALLKDARITMSIASFDLDEKDWRAILPKVQTHWRLKGELHSLESLSAYWKSLDWFKLTSTPLTIDGDIGVKDGAFEEGGKLAFNAADIKVSLLGQTISGPGALTWAIAKTNAVELKIGRFELNKGRDATGEGFRFEIATEDRHIIQEWDRWDARITLPAARVHRIQFVQTYIPKSLPLVLEKGTGTLKADIQASSDVGRSHGEVDLAAKDIQAIYKKNLRFIGEIDSHIKFDRVDLQKGEMNVPTANLKVKQLSFLDKKNWQGSLAFSGAKIRLANPQRLSGQVKVEGDNLQPVLAFLNADQNFPKWLMKAFDLEKPKVDFNIAATDDTLKVRDFAATAGDFKIQGWADQGPKARRARFLLEYGSLAGGYGFDGDTSLWKLANARAWFESEAKQKL